MVGERIEVGGEVDEGPLRDRVGAARAGTVERHQPHTSRGGRRVVRAQEARAGRAVEEDDGEAVGDAPLGVREPSAVGEPQRGVDARVGRAQGRYSCTSSIRVPNAVFGWTNATVVPRLPGRGASSMTRCPPARTAASAAAQSSTR